MPPRKSSPTLPILILWFYLPCLSALPETIDHPSLDFTKEIVPILAEHCTRCHGDEIQKSRLRLDQPQFITIGGNSGEPLFVPGSAESSFLYQLVAGTHADLRMPPKGDGLSQNDLERVRQWIDTGAKLPSVAGVNEQRIKTEHWSFQPLSQPPPPKSHHPFPKNPIDRFIGASLNSHGLYPSPPADRRTLIRRLYLTTLGLPPTPQDVESFVTDESPTAYDKRVDQVLGSPHYGERWARHWLDIVRYADTNGYETNRERKSAYRYRDYVIDALNQDRPYNQFILDQLAGDTVGRDIGTGFLVAGPYDIVKSPDINLTLTQRQDELADMINATGTTFLGLTIGCARCHNHKFDPILQKDYYAFQAVFAGVNHGERNLNLPIASDTMERIATIEKRLAKAKQTLTHYQELALEHTGTAAPKPRESVNFRRNEERFGPIPVRFVRFTITATNSGNEPCIDELEIYNTAGKNIALSTLGTTATASGTLPGFSIHKLEHINDGQTGNSRSWISNTANQGWVTLSWAENQTIERIVWGRDRDGQFSDRLPTEYQIEVSLNNDAWKQVASSTDRAPFQGKAEPNAFVNELPPREAHAARNLIGEIQHLETRVADLRNGPKAWVGNFNAPPTTHRLYRGEPQQKREPVAPDGLTVMGSLGMAMDEPEAKRRQKLAHWIAKPSNPLTARVIVNRLWQYTFGQGIVATPSDFGANGALPTHPELLDWLAHELIKADWSLKHIQRLILSSHTFQQTSRPNPAGLKQDADGTLLWRFPPRRLEAEAIRDSVLAVSGELDLTQGGPGFYLHRVQVENVMHYFPKEQFGPEESRRMVYLFKIRQEQDAIFGAFDCPDGNQTIPRRSRSNTPLQALNLFNSRFIVDQSEHLAARLHSKAANDISKQVEQAFHLFYARPPDDFERSASLDLIDAEGLAAFCRALYNSSEFLFVF